MEICGSTGLQKQRISYPEANLKRVSNRFIYGIKCLIVLMANNAVSVLHILAKYNKKGAFKKTIASQFLSLPFLMPLTLDTL